MKKIESPISEDVIFVQKMKNISNEQKLKRAFFYYITEEEDGVHVTPIP